jgi:hypothetical protein
MTRRRDGTVDLTPTWKGVLPALIWATRDGTDRAGLWLAWS